MKGRLENIFPCMSERRGSNRICFTTSFFSQSFFTEVWHSTGWGWGNIHSWIWRELGRSTSPNYKQWEWDLDDFSKECSVAFITTWENAGKILDGLKKKKQKTKPSRKTNNCALPGKNREIYLFKKIYFILPNSNAVIHMWFIGFLFIFTSPNQIHVIRLIG